MGLIQSAKLVFNHDEAKTSGRNPGPMSAGLGERVSDGEFVARFATASEWKSFRAVVEERRAAEPRWRFYKCTGNPKCSFKFQLPYKPESMDGENCIRCNHQAFQIGGHLKEMTAREVSTWQTEEAERIKQEGERDRKGKEFREEMDRKSRGLA